MKTVPTPGHSTWQDLLQILGACAIVAFHTQAPLAQAGWAAVELFFVMAGMRMGGALKREQSLAAYTLARTQRLFPEVCAVWIVVLLLVVCGRGTDGMKWFLGTAPFHLQNLTPLFFRYDLPKDAVFGPLWFVGVLMQLQVLLFLFKKPLGRMSPGWILAAALAAGIVLRAVFTHAYEGGFRSLEGSHAGILYCMPFCHLEALVLGFLMQRGAFPRIGRCLPLSAGLVVALGLLNMRFSSGQLGLSGLGYEFPLRTNFSQLWGYPVLAFFAAGLCAKDSPLARAVDRRELPAWVIRGISTMAALTYGVYCFHGLIIGTGLNAASWFGGSVMHRTALFGITLIEAIAFASAFRGFQQWISRFAPSRG